MRFLREISDRKHSDLHHGQSPPQSLLGAAHFPWLTTRRSTRRSADRTNDAEITEYFASIYGFRVVFAVDNFAN